tara:strand:- start:3948 stop:4958 length:1011 start_codon:yes stop_codon:yes gene_type:complete
MTLRVAINGFGRIGRLILRAIHESNLRSIQVVAVNDLGTVETNAHLLRRDSIHGAFPGDITTKGSTISIGRRKILTFSERDPKKLPWKKLKVDVALECTGHFTSRNTAASHLTAGAQRVLISAPGTDADATIVYGVNQQILRKKHRVISNASCTTNCLAPVAMVMQRTVGISHGYMTTIHSYTSDQPVLDTLHSDPRRARAAALSMIPTSTGAARAVGLVLPDLAGKLDGTAIRVPTANVSLIDFTFVAQRKTNAKALNKAIIRASKRKHLKGILETSDEPLVSSDFNHNPASSTFDLTQTQVINGKLCRVVSWYDNEWGFANRMVDTAHAVGMLG